MNYVPRGYGLALTIREDSDIGGGNIDAERSIDRNDAGKDDLNDCDESDRPNVDDGDDAGAGDGYLTVIESGVTTLELRRPDGESSYLIWDESEVEWDCLRAG